MSLKKKKELVHIGSFHPHQPIFIGKRYREEYIFYNFAIIAIMQPIEKEKKGHHGTDAQDIV